MLIGFTQILYLRASAKNVYFISNFIDIMFPIIYFIISAGLSLSFAYTVNSVRLTFSVESEIT